LVKHAARLHGATTPAPITRRVAGHERKDERMTDETKCPSCGDVMEPLGSGGRTSSHSNKTCPLGFRPWTGYELKIIGEALVSARVDAMREWFAVLDDAAVLNWVLPSGEIDAKTILRDIIDQQVREALDPAISQSAAALVAEAEKRGYERAREQAGRLCHETEEKVRKAVENLVLTEVEAREVLAFLGAYRDDIRLMQTRPAEAGENVAST
jgi:hypothetical protein